MKKKKLSYFPNSSFITFNSSFITFNTGICKI